jgi:hypothetical protein
MSTSTNTMARKKVTEVPPDEGAGDTGVLRLDGELVRKASLVVKYRKSKTRNPADRKRVNAASIFSPLFLSIVQAEYDAMRAEMDRDDKQRRAGST